MPYRRYKKTVFKKVKGKWVKRNTYPTMNRARRAVERFRSLEKKA